MSVSFFSGVIEILTIYGVFFQLQSDIILRETVTQLVSSQVEMKKLDDGHGASSRANLTMFPSSNPSRSANLAVSENLAPESEKMPRATTQSALVLSAVLGVCMCVFVAIAISHYSQFTGGLCTRS